MSQEITDELLRRIQEKSEKTAKKKQHPPINIIFFSLIVLLIGLLMCGGCNKDKHVGQVKTPSSSSTYVGKDYHIALKAFEDKGFTNIIVEPKEDLIFGWLAKEDECEEVSVGGNSDYVSDKWVDANIEVIIVYHTFPSDEEETKEVEPTAKAEPTVKSDDSQSVAPQELSSTAEATSDDEKEGHSSSASSQANRGTSCSPNTSTYEKESSDIPLTFEMETTIDDASDFFDRCVIAACPYGVKIHQMDRVEAPVDDTTIYICKKVEVENAYGNMVKMVACGSVEIVDGEFVLQEFDIQ